MQIGKDVSIAMIRAGGSALDTSIVIDVPPNAHRVKWFAMHLNSIAIVNRLRAKVNLKAGAVDYGVVFTTSLFSLDGGAIGTPSFNENTNTLAADQLNWQIQANAGATTQFILRLKFYDV